MRVLLVAVASALFVGMALALPILAPIEHYPGETTGGYLVQLKEGAALATVLQALGIVPRCQWKALNGFSGFFNAATLTLIRASPDVELVAEDGIMHALATTQPNAPWGLARISTRESLAGGDVTLLGYPYRYDDSAGEGVDIYIVDTGVYTQHEDFDGRATWGKTFGLGYQDSDGNGHGTHCAGTAAGTTYGVAKKANIIAVKVLSDQGSGSTADIICGIDWVIEQVSKSGRASVISMSLGGGVSSRLDNAVKKATDSGIHVVVAAGNSNVDAANTSPARAPSAITVGATTIDDSRASFSNFGSIVDIFAPGQNITSAWIGSPNASNRISGTSMATPHVAGLIAYLLKLEGTRLPSEMSDRLKELSQKGALSNIPPNTNTENRLAKNGIMECDACN